MMLFILLSTLTVSCLSRRSRNRYQRYVQYKYLYQSDFARGTFRITEPGHYRFAEDITFDPNPGLANEPDAWLPKYPEQNDDYPPNPYRLGFFAAITIECEDVVLDLGGHTLKMSRAFFLQQRFHALISLASTPFIAGQGPTNFGPISSASNCCIRNGKLRRTSHHAISGNNVDTCLIENLDIADFEVGGIALNNIQNVKIRNVKIANSLGIPFSGDYAGARFMVRFFRQIFTQSQRDTNTITFHDGRTYTLQEIVDRLVYSMDLMFRYFVHHEGPFDSDPAWGEFFASPTGLPDGSALYGININGLGMAVGGLGISPVTSEDVEIKNVKISNLRVAPKERVRFFQKIDSTTLIPAVGGTGDSFDVYRVADNFDDPTTAVYIGTRLSDAQLALDKFAPANSFVRHTLSIPPVIRDWALTGTSIPAGSFQLMCNGDTQFHVQKGAIALRIDSTKDFKLKRVTIENIRNSGGFGSTACGPYKKGSDGAHPDQELDGYRGSVAYGVSIFESSGKVKRLKVSGINSVVGIAFGMHIEDAKVDFKQKNWVKDIFAEGTSVPPEQNQMGFTLPNYVPQACGVYVAGNACKLGGHRRVKVRCVTGMTYCSPTKTMFGVARPGYC